MSALLKTFYSVLVLQTAVDMKGSLWVGKKQQWIIYDIALEIWVAVDIKAAKGRTVVTLDLTLTN